MARKLSIPEKEAKARLNERTGLLLILVLAAGMRLFNLGGFSMWFDEAYSWHLAKESVSRIIELARIDNTPPVYHIFLHYWLKAGAVSDFMIRLPAAIFGILSVLFTFKLGKLVFDRRTALTAALLSAASFQLVHYSQENRMYSLQLLLGLISTYYFVLGLRTEERKHWLLWAGATVLSFYTQLFTVFLVFAQWVYFILTINANRKNIINWAAVNALVFIVCLPWLTVVFSQMGAIQDDYWVLPATLQEAVKAGFRLMGGTDIGDRYLLTALLNIPFILASIYGLVSLYRDRKGGDKLLFPLLFFLPIMVVYAISAGGQSLFYYRYFVFLIPYLLLIIAFGMSRPAGWWKKSAVYTPLLGVMAVFLYFYYTVPAYSEPLRMPLRDAAVFLGEHADDDAVLIHHAPGNIGMDTFYTNKRYSGGRYREYVWRDIRPPFYFGGSLYRDEYGITDIDFHSSDNTIWIVSSIFGGGELNEMGMPSFTRGYSDYTALPEAHPDRLWIELAEAGYSLKDKTWFGEAVIGEFVKGDH